MTGERILILNPRAGAVSDEAMVDQVASAVQERLPMRVMRTRSPEDARIFGRTAGLDGAMEVLVAGGDGTVSEVVHGLWELQSTGGESGPAVPTISILPLGIGNDLARCLGIPLEWEAALALVGEGGWVRRLDMLEVVMDGTRDVAVNAVVVGTGGRVSRVLDEADRERWGPLSYLRSAAEVMLHPEPSAMELSWDGSQPETLRVLNVVAANGRYAARGVPIAPRADPGDGRMELVVIQEVRMTDLLTMLPAILREEDADHEAYIHRQVRRARITSLEEKPLPVSVDGESRTAEEIVVTILPGVLPVRVPRDPATPQRGGAA